MSEGRNGFGSIGVMHVSHIRIFKFENEAGAAKRMGFVFEKVHRWAKGTKTVAFSHDTSAPIDPDHCTLDGLAATLL